MNTKGTNDGEVSPDLVEFLHYVEHSNDETAVQLKSEAVKKIHERVRTIKSSEEIGVKYMQAWEEKIYEREEGRAEGEALFAQLSKILVRESKNEELIRAADDIAYREELYKSFNLLK